MDNAIVKWVFRILRILLPASAVAMGTIHGSYMKMVTTEDGQIVETAASYFVLEGVNIVDFAPLACMLLCIAAVGLAIFCAFKETEDHLVWLGHALSIGMVVDILMMILMSGTILGWCIALVLGIALTITVLQEMHMERSKKNA